MTDSCPALALIAFLCVSIGKTSDAQAPAEPAPYNLISLANQVMARTPGTRGVTSVQVTGTIETHPGSLSTPFELSLGTEERLRMVFALPGGERLVRGRDSSVAWEIVGSGHVRPMTDSQAEIVAAFQGIVSPLWQSAGWSQYSTSVRSSFHGIPCIAIRRVFPAGRVAMAYFSLRDSVLVGVSEYRDSASGVPTTEDAFNGYRDFGFGRIPTEKIHRTGKLEQITRIERVLYNTVPESVFTRPSNLTVKRPALP